VFSTGEKKKSLSIPSPIFSLF